MTRPVGSHRPSEDPLGTFLFGLNPVVFPHWTLEDVSELLMGKSCRFRILESGETFDMAWEKSTQYFVKSQGG